jgi:tetratricopeptide (TPR) repeat protein
VKLPVRSPSSASAESSRHGRILLLLALLMTALAYLGTLRFGFVYDDWLQIVHNPTLTSWRSLPGLYSGGNWKFLFPGWAGNYYRPLFTSWLLVNRMLWGLNPGFWHASTVFVHLLATAMAFLLARKILGNGTEAGFVALLFGLHPIHIESVAWISGVTDPLMAVFVFAAFWAWIRGEESPGSRGWWQALAAFFYLCACLAKETALLFPLLIIVYQILFRGERNFPRSLVRTWMLWIAAAIYLVARTLALRGIAHPLGEPLAHVLLTVPAIVCGYLRRLVWPFGLSLFYDTPPVTGVLQWRFWLPLLGCVLLGWLAWRFARRSRIALISLLWMAAFLSPAIFGLPIFEVGEWMHDRYLYLPSFGLCLLAGHLIARLPQRQKLFGFPAASTSAIFCLAAILSFATAWQEQYWANSLLLYVHSVNESPNSVWAKGYLAGEVLRSGDRLNAARLYEAALKLDPNNWKNNTGYALMLYSLGDYHRADQLFTHALAIDPSDPTTHFNQGLSRFNDGNYAGAETSLREALRRNPQMPAAHYWLGYSLEEQGKFAAARCEYLAELQAYPNSTTDARQRAEMMAAKLRNEPADALGACPLLH